MTTSKKLPLIFSLVLTFFFSISLHAQTIRYVTTTGAGTKTGTSWANASDDLQLMINNSAVNDQVWVKKGIFTPKYTIDGYAVNITASYPYERWASFNIKSGVKIYGGFLGTETMLPQRGVGDRTTLSGDIKENDYYYSWYLGSQKIYSFFDNAFILVNALNCSSATVFDGFNVKNGSNEKEINPTLFNPSGFTLNGCFVSNVDGAGMSIYNSNLSIKNCTFENNTSLRYGAVGVFQNSNPTIENCTFQYNRSIKFAHAYGYTDNRGCGLACKDASMSVKNCVFLGNKGYLGTAVFLDNAPSSSRFENCTFVDNINLYFGSQMPAIYCTTSNTTCYNCTVNISSFQTNNGRPFVNEGGAPKLRNCILWSTQNGTGVTSSGNSADIQNSIIIGGYPGINNSDRNPNLVFSGTKPLLGACSPAYNTGTNIGAPTTDIDGNPIFGGTRDMGACESQTNLASTQSTVTIAANPGTTVAWNNPLTFTATMSPVVANSTYTQRKMVLGF